MSAPDLETLYALQQAFEPAVAQVNNDATGVPCFTTFDTDTEGTPRIEVRLEVGAWTGHYGFQGATPRQDAWNARLVVAVVTNRQDAGQDGVHAAAVALVRSTLIQGSLFTTELLPYHAFTDLREEGAGVDTLSEEDEDRTEISYAALINIRADAWPVG